jgi:hypothetical protein
MEIVGIVKTKPTYEMKGALDANYPVFASTAPFISYVGFVFTIPTISMSS